MAETPPPGAERRPPEILVDPAQVETVPIDSIEPHPDNPRLGDVDAIRLSIRTTGFFQVVLVQAHSRRILVGEHRWRAAKAEGLTEIPIAPLHVDDETALRIMLSDNRMADRADWDDEVLMEVLETVEDLIGTGFEDEIGLETTQEVAIPEAAPAHFPLTPRFGEKYSYVIIMARCEADETWLLNVLELEREASYKNTRVAVGRVVDVGRFQQLLEALR